MSASVRINCLLGGEHVAQVTDTLAPAVLVLALGLYSTALRVRRNPVEIIIDDGEGNAWEWNVGGTQALLRQWTGRP